MAKKEGLSLRNLIFGDEAGGRVAANASRIKRIAHVARDALPIGFAIDENVNEVDNAKFA